MAWGDTWLSGMRAALIQILGQGPTGNDGAALPALRSVDTIAVMGQVTPALVSCINRYASQVCSADIFHACADVSLQNDDGTPRASGSYVQDDGTISTASFTADSVCMAAVYMTLAPQRDASDTLTNAVWRTDANGKTFSPWCKSADGQSQALFGFVKQCIADWQRMCEASAATLFSNSADTTQPMDTDGVSEFWAALAALCSDLDTMAENPPVGVSIDTLSKALGYAINRSANVVGQTAAQIANKAGDVAGQVASGFFGSAGPVALLVAGLVIFMYVR